MLIAKNTPIPATFTKYFELEQPDQKFVEIKVRDGAGGRGGGEEGVGTAVCLSYMLLFLSVWSSVPFMAVNKVYEGESPMAADNYELASLVFPVGGEAVLVERDKYRVTLDDGGGAGRGGDGDKDGGG